VDAFPRFVALAGLVLLSAANVSAQTPNATTEPTLPAWLFRATGATYLLPDEDDYVQPTFTADRGALHLETRYNYEGRRSMSGFVGWNLQAGTNVTLEATPMAGAVFGETDGLIPALALTLGFRSLEFYAENEYVFDLNSSEDSFFYNWSEFSVWATDWLRAGIVTQRTRVFQQPREIQRGFLIGAMAGRVEGTVYVFNPGSDDHYVVASIGLSF
jgi:hypothetical protein